MCPDAGQGGRATATLAHRHTKQPQWSLCDVLHQLRYLKVCLVPSIAEKVNWGAALDLYFQRSEFFFLAIRQDQPTNIRC
jgi:hypothetical protein